MSGVGNSKILHGFSNYSNVIFNLEAIFLEHQCPKCNIVMTRTRATGKLSAIKEPIKNFTTKFSPLIPFVCSNCGLTDWYVEEPYKFK
jgi:hypothetical protein